ncbi:myosuppressin [Agrilus planipennis]|uniref:Myosuppressin n=1 Tax=Agrilus planipennis TaxID=224129 RepID=A0A1W4WT06_AGRPL|nr:myosuppressin [Agrilus planipennis]
MNQHLLSLVTVTVFMVLFSLTLSMPPLQNADICSADAPPRLKKLCLLATLKEYFEEPIEPVVKGEIMDTELYSRGAKRQDVDHVFLRFGRRLGL